MVLRNLSSIAECEPLTCTLCTFHKLLTPSLVCMALEVSQNFLSVELGGVVLIVSCQLMWSLSVTSCCRRFIAAPDIRWMSFSVSIGTEMPKTIHGDSFGGARFVVGG